MERRTFMRGLAASSGLAVGGIEGGVTATASATKAPDVGDVPTWTSGKQYGVGTVADHGADDPSRTWFALVDGALAGVRYPRIDLLNLRTLDFLVVDGEYTARTYNTSRLDDGESTVERSTEPVDDDALLFRQTTSETGSGRDWTIEVEYAAHPDHDAVLADVDFEAHDGNEYDVYAVVDPSVSQSGLDDVASIRGGNGSDEGDGNGNGDGYVLTAHDTTANDDEAAIVDENGDSYNVALAVAADRGFDWATVDVVGGDAVEPLLSSGDAGTRYDGADGNVAMVGRLASGVRRVADAVSLGFATERDAEAAAKTARTSLDRSFGHVRAKYRKSWREYLSDLSVPDAVAGDDDLRKQYDAAAMSLKAAESKRFAGAGIASPSIPWGDFVLAKEPSDYGYNYVWSRDQYQVFTALLELGDVDTARRAVEYVYEYQQRENGFLPQNTFVDGRTRWGGEQMDNISFPQLMAYQLKERHGIGFDDADYDYENVRRSADYVVRNGPATGQERWEEESGYSPSTTAAEIAGLVAAASLANDERERADLVAYLGLADYWQSHVEDWMATTTGTSEHENTPYYVRIDDDRDPDDGAGRDINNGGPTLDERDVVDAGFLELVRLGVVPWDDPTVRNSLEVVDDSIRVDTPHGPAWYRYTDDGYGEQGEPESEDDLLREGAGWGAQITADGKLLPDENGDGTPDADMSGRGRLWPIFSGERGEYELLAETTDGPLAPANLLRTMQGFANSGRMISEQVWDREDPTDFGWEFGEGTGSATPLSWSMAQFVRLAWGIDAGRPVETPAAVRERYVAGEPPEGPSLSVDFPDDLGSSSTVTISGTTDAADVVVQTPSGMVHETPTCGSFSVDVDVDVDSDDGDGDDGGSGENGARLRVVAATAGETLADVGTTLRERTLSNASGS